MMGHAQVPPRTEPFAQLHRDALFLVWGPPSHGPRSQVFARELGIDIEFVYWTKRRGLLISPFKYGYQAVKTLTLLFRRRPRIVFVQSPPSFAVMFVALYCAVMGSGFLVDAHSAAMQSPRWTRPRWLLRYLGRRAAATIVTNEHFAQEVRRHGGHALVIPDIPTTFPIGPLPTLRETFNILVVGTFSPDEPLAAVIAAAKELPEVSFFVTGDRRGARQALPEHVPDNIRFTGFLPAESYYGLMASCHAVMCLTRRDHTMQRGACEALSLGRPIITSNSPLLRDYFSKGTVHVENTAVAIVEGVRQMIRHHSRYEAQIRELQTKRRLEWRSAADVLRQVVDRVDLERGRNG